MPELSAKLLMTFCRTAAMKTLAAMGGFALLMVTGHMYGVQIAGAFALAQGLIYFCANLSKYGMDFAFVRFGYGRGAYYLLDYALKRAFLCGCLLSLAIYFSHDVLQKFIHTDLLLDFYPAIYLAMPALGVVYIFSGALQAKRKPAVSFLFQNGGVAIITLVPFLTIWFGFSWRPSTVIFGLIYAGSSWLLALIGLFTIYLPIRHSSKSDRKPKKSRYLSFRKSSSAFFAIGMAHVLFASASIWICGYFSTPESVGQYKAAEQVALVVAMIITVMNSILPAKFANLLVEKNTRAVEALARKGVLLGVAFVVVPTVIFFSTPDYILSLFGDGFSGGKVPLLILCGAQAINVALGSPGFILNMGGYEYIERNFAWLVTSIGMVFMFVFGGLWGINGVAISVALVLIVKKLVGIFFVWKKLEIWYFPAPNIMRALNIPTCISAI